MVFFGADGKVTANVKDVAAKWYPKDAVNAPYKESYTFEHGGHVFFHCHAEEFNEKLLHFVAAVDNRKF